MTEQKVSQKVSLLTEHDIYLFKKGSHYKLYEKLGAHIINDKNKKGVYFAVWAPSASSVSVIGDFNGWNNESHKLGPRWDGSGIWEGFIPNLGKGQVYKYHIVSSHHYRVNKADPYAFLAEEPPKTASTVWDMDYRWSDAKWMKSRKKNNSLNAPISAYEVHLGSWARVPEEDLRFLTYREMAEKLPDYIKLMGFTHVEFMPIMEHPFYASWGYQVTGYFAPSRRYGTPQDFMYLIDKLHQHDIGVIIDWVPSHFPSDEHGLVYFDGTHVYEHQDPREGFHPDWNSYIFNYGRNEVQNFLISSALFWLDKYHIDGIRVDGVASMLYRDYSRKAGEWIPNEHGGRENIEAINFLRQFNEAVYTHFPDVQTIAEESTAWPMVSRPTYAGGLGFGMKWNMGWMHDTLEYFAKDPIYRMYNHEMLTFSLIYAFNENFMLPLSHDEVVHGKGSLLAKMPGDEWQKFANLRALFSYMFTHPGKKLLFMGGEFAQSWEWYHDASLSWDLLQYDYHHGIQKLVRDLNKLYKNNPALYELDFQAEGFEWIDWHDHENSVISYRRKASDPKGDMIVVCNFTPVPRYNYRVGVPRGGFWEEVLNSDAKEYNGSGQGNMGGIEAAPVSFHGKYDWSLSATLPPMAVLVFQQNQEQRK